MRAQNVLLWRWPFEPRSLGKLAPRPAGCGIGPNRILSPAWPAKRSPYSASHDGPVVSPARWRSRLSHRTPYRQLYLCLRGGTPGTMTAPTGHHCGVDALAQASRELPETGEQPRKGLRGQEDHERSSKRSDYTGERLRTPSVTRSTECLEIRCLLRSVKRCLWGTNNPDMAGNRQYGKPYPVLAGLSGLNRRKAAEDVAP